MTTREPLTPHGRRTLRIWLIIALVLIATAWTAMGFYRTAAHDPIVATLGWSGAIGAAILSATMAVRSWGVAAGAWIGVGVGFSVALVGATIASIVQPPHASCFIMCDSAAVFLYGFALAIVLAMVCALVGAIAAGWARDERKAALLA